jgi:hypothetical protein
VSVFYFYLWDADFGPGFVKICTYFPYPIEVWLNGHESAKQQARKAGMSFTALSNGFAATDDPVGLQAICDRLGPGTIGVFVERWLSRLPLPLTPADRAAGFWWELSMRQIQAQCPGLRQSSAERWSPRRNRPDASQSPLGMSSVATARRLGWSCRATDAPRRRGPSLQPARADVAAARLAGAVGTGRQSGPGPADLQQLALQTGVRRDIGHPLDRDVRTVTDALAEADAAGSRPLGRRLDDSELRVELRLTCCERLRGDVGVHADTPPRAGAFSDAS